MDYKRIHSFGITADHINNIQCQCGSTDVDIAYSLTSDTIHIQCQRCNKFHAQKDAASAIHNFNPTKALASTEDKDVQSSFDKFLEAI
jgi:hypothetical protein